MLLKFGTLCRSRGQELGSLWGVSIEPRERLLLQLIVEQPQAEPRVRVRVPFGRLERADASQVVLTVSPTEMETLPRWVRETYSSSEGRKGRRRRRGDEVVEKVLTGETKVHCRDGEAGPLRALTVDARSGDLEDLSFETGAMVGREAVLPIREVDDLDDGRINVKLERDELSDLPSRKV